MSIPIWSRVDSVPLPACLVNLFQLGLRAPYGLEGICLHTVMRVSAVRHCALGPGPLEGPSRLVAQPVAGWTCVPSLAVLLAREPDHGRPHHVSNLVCIPLR